MISMPSLQSYRQLGSAYWRLARLDRPIGTFLLLWPCLMALFFAAQGIPDMKVLWVFIAGVFVMRACGCVINDFADRKFDGHVERTQGRPLATGELSSQSALGFFVFLALIAFGLVLLLNPLVIKLSVIGIVLTILYPFMKRHTHVPQMFLGVAWSWSIPMAYAAQLGYIPLEAWWLFAANWCWTVAYDTMYGMVDRDDDLKVGIKSTAILFGQYDRHWVAAFQFAALLCFMMAGLSAERGLIYGLGVFVFVGFCIYQQILIHERQKAHCLHAFLNNNWAGLLLWGSLAIDYALT